MNEFDGKKFYGFSLHNDPSLSTTTRNFEFKYARAEHLERAIQKVQHNEPDNDRQRKKDALTRVCKSKKIPVTEEVHRAYQRDADVETHLSRGDTPGRVRALSNTEINQLIDKVRSYSDLRSQNSTDTYAKGKDITKATMKPPTMLKSILRPTNNEFPRGGTIGGTYFPHMRTQEAHELDDEAASCDGEVFCSDSTSEDQILCNPFDLTHEPYFETHSMHMPHVRRELHSGVSKLPDVPEEDELFATKQVMPVMVEEFREAQPKWVEICEEPAKTQAQFGVIKKALHTDSLALVSVQRGLDGNVEDRFPTNVTYTKHSHEMQLPIPVSTPELMLTNMPPPPSLPNLALTYPCTSYEDQASTYYVEDSDLEYELIGREEYTKLCGPRPKAEELTNNSEGSGGLAEFVEVESKMPCMDMSFLKNVSPLRYSDKTDDREDDRMLQPIKVVIKSNSKKSPLPITEKETPAPSVVKEVKKKTPKPKKKPVEEPKPIPRKKLSARYTDSSPVKEKSPRSTPRLSGRRSMPTTPRHSKDSAHQSKPMSSNELRLMKNIVLSKSIEDLKIEKMGIFAKMTNTQERIIETLDKLRISLLELYVPDSHYEKSRRQKNAFEFSVRFSRNFLYPLKGMIEDLRLVSVEQLCSASSNESTQRVLNIFVLIQQSLQTYYKQLRYFLLDQVPQKLNTLIELASTTINICLEKQVFDRNDAIIECLQERCSKFLGFLEDMHEERFLTARENYRKAFDKTSSNYSLKMFMNDLNMYEPKLVPKNHYNQRRKPKQRRVLKPSSTTTKVKSNAPIITTPKTSQMVITRPDGDHLSTQVNEVGTSSGLFHSATDKIVPPAEPTIINSEDLPNLNKALIEALQTVTKEQMRQVLQPIMQTLGTVLEKKNASKTIDELLNAFSKNLVSLAESEQPKKTSQDQYSGNGEKVRVGYESKAAKQTERHHHSRRRHSNSESTKRDDDDPAAAFFGNAMAPASGTAVCDVDVDDDDDEDNYYDDYDFERDDCAGNNADDDDDADDDADYDEDDKGRRYKKGSTDLLASNEPTEPTEPTEATGRTSESKSNINISKASSNNKIVVFDNFNLGTGGKDEASESGSDFESFEGTSSQFEVVIAMKPDKNKVNEQEQARQQQQTQVEPQQQKQQCPISKKEQQKQQFVIYEPLKQNKQQQQQLQQVQQQQDCQLHKSLRERAENYDTHIQQQQQLTQQQAYEELLKQQRELKKHSQSSANDMSTPDEIFRKSRDLQKQLENQLEEHQRYISAQQQQRRLHQKLLKEQQMLQHEASHSTLKDQQKLQQQQQLKVAPMPPPKPETRKQIQSQTQQQLRSTVPSRHSFRNSTSTHPPSARAPPPQLATSRGRVSSRAKMPTCSRVDLQGDRLKVLKKRGRNPLNSPPPAPSVTPSNSARTPRSHVATSSTVVGDGGRHIDSPSPRSHTKVSSGFAEPNVGFPSDRGGGGDNADAIIISDATRSQISKIGSILKTDIIDVIVPLANAFHVDGGEGGKDVQRSPRSPRTSRQNKPSSTTITQKSEVLANHDLIEALTNCLFNFNSGEKENVQKTDKYKESVQVEDGGGEGGDTPESLTLYTGESPYERMKSKKAKHQLKKDKSKISQKQISKDSNENDSNDWHQANTKDDGGGGDINLHPLASPCSLWNANLKPAIQKKDLHIEELIAERDQFLRLCGKNRFYANPNFNQPWNVFSKLAARLSNDIVGLIEEDFSIGVSKFVQDFLDNETKI